MGFYFYYEGVGGRREAMGSSRSSSRGEGRRLNTNKDEWTNGTNEDKRSGG